MFSKNPLYINDIEMISRLTLPWDKLQDAQIFISGATGMIGTFLIDVFMERNQEYNNNIHIYAAGRSIEKAKQRFCDYLDLPYFTFLTCDINNPITLDEKFDYIFHCASNTHPKAYATDPIGTIMTNVIGTQNMLDLAVKSNSKRLLFLSSVEIYGENNTEKTAFTEEDFGYIDCNTVRAGYPEGKRTGEALCQAYIQMYGIDIVIPRICRVYGPTMLDSDSKALAQFIKKAVVKENIILKSKGTQYFSYCYVGDVVSALLYLLFYGKNGEAYNISDEKSDIQLKDLAGILAKLAGTQVVFDLPDETESKGFSKATVAILNSDKMKELGWKVSDNIETSLSKTVSILSER